MTVAETPVETPVKTPVEVFEPLDVNPNNMSIDLGAARSAENKKPMDIGFADSKIMKHTAWSRVFSIGTSRIPSLAGKGDQWILSTQGRLDEKLDEKAGEKLG